MINRTRFVTALLALTTLAGTCFSQNESPKPPDTPKAFQLDFVVKELEDGKVVNARNYSMIVTADSGNGSIRSGDKLPVKAKGGPQSEYTYLDVGVNIDCRAVREIQGKLTLIVTADVSAAASDAAPPLVRSTKWSSNVVLPFRKPTTLFSSDDTSSRKKMQLELTASQILP